MNHRIRKIRKELDLTQKEFASRIGTSQNVLANYETGRRNPSASVINNICKTFHVNETWLRTGEGDTFCAVNTEHRFISWAKTISAEEDTSFKKRFLAMLMELDETKWDLLEEIVQKTMESLPNQSSPQEMTAAEAEAAYIKSRSKNARTTVSPVLSITADAATDKNIHNY